MAPFHLLRSESYAHEGATLFALASVALVLCASGMFAGGPAGSFHWIAAEHVSLGLSLPAEEQGVRIGPRAAPTPDNPVPATHHNLALKAASGASSEFFGQATSAGWENLTPDLNLSPPLDVDYQSMALDPFDGYAVLFGGFDLLGGALNETWVFNGSAWQQLHPSVSPPARGGASLVWDSVDHYLLLFGGNDGGTIDFNDSWAFVHGTWTLLHPSSGGPSPREWAAETMDQAAGYVLLFGGYDSTDHLLNDTWTFVGGNWTELQAESPPQARAGAALAYDPTLGYAVLFGGYNHTLACCGTDELGDTWMFSGGTWSKASGSNGPAPRSFAGFGYLPSVGALILVGGSTSQSTDASDTWWYTGGGWSNRTSLQSPGHRTEALIASDPAGQALISYGGWEGSQITNDTWAYYTVNLTVSTPTSSGDAPLNTTFSASATGGSSPYTYGWALPDGRNLTGAEVALGLNASGNYSIEVNVADALGVQSSAAVEIRVYPSLRLIAVAAPLSGHAPLNVSFSGAASGGKPPYVFDWTPVPGVNFTTGNATYTYAVPGEYVAVVSLSDQFGPGARASFPVQVTAPLTVQQPLSLSLTANRTIGTAPLAVQFSTSLSGGSPPFDFSWTFGDGTQSNTTEPDHVFLLGGTYSVKVNVTDGQGFEIGSAIQVSVAPPLVISVSGSSVEGVAPFKANFSSDVSGGWPPYVVLWAFGDGSVAVAGNADHQYSDPGNYTVSAEVIDALGGRNSSTLPLVQVLPAPVSQQNPSSGGWTLPAEAAVLLSVGFLAGVIASYAVIVVFKRRKPLGPRNSD